MIQGHGKLLGQARPANTTAVTIYSPPVNVWTEITKVIICNTSGSSAKFRLFLDDDGTTYDQTTALYYDAVVAADDTIEVPSQGNNGFFMNIAAGNLAVRTDTNNALTFSVFGIENRYGHAR